MNGDNARPVDLDLLADYSAGALDTAQAALVADLITNDDQWARSYDELVRAEAAVRSDLRVAAEATGPMPEDVAARLDATLATLAGLTDRSLTDRSLTDRSLTDRGGRVVSLDAERTRRRRRIATAIAGAAAAGVAVIGGLTVASNVDQMAGSAAEVPAMAEQGSGGSPPLEPAPQADDRGGWPIVLASGRDYRPDSLREIQADTAPAPPKIAGESPQADFSLGEAPKAAAGGGLAALATPAALDACLAAINAIHPGVAAIVDFARYEGVPALITLVRQGATSIIVVVGAECGANDADLITTAPA